VIPHVALCDVAPAAPCANENRFTLCHAGLFDGRRDPAKLLGAVRRLLPTLAKEHTLQLILMGNSYDTTADLELPVDLKPYVNHIVSIFDWDLIMFGSDWPVVKLAASYARWLATVRSLLSHLSADERRAVFFENARRCYRLPSSKTNSDIG